MSGMREDKTTDHSLQTRDLRPEGNDGVSADLTVRDEFVVNYFNYFTDIEEHFIRRRGKHLLVSPLDWALIESWKDMNVPLHIVLRGIDRVFDAHKAAGEHRTKRINSILYCQQAVIECHEEYLHARVGASPETSETSPERTTQPSASALFSKKTILEYLSDRIEDLKNLTPSFESEGTSLSETLMRAIDRLSYLLADARTAEMLDLETLEQELGRIEKAMYQSLVESVPPDELKKLRKEGAKQLREYKERMSQEVYEQTLDNYVAKRLRESYRIPRLSLFYL